MSWLEAFFLGLVQGLTEFLPVSSSGHLVLFGKLLGVSTEGLTWEVWLHLATLTAVVIALWPDLLGMLRSLGPGTASEDRRASRQLVWGVVIGTVPALFAGLLLKDLVEAAFASVRLVGLDLIFTAGILFASRFFSGGSATLTSGRAFLVGCAQALAILPGISRAGCTLTVGLMMGLPGVEAARFSFILSVPVILGAVALEFSSLLSLGSTAPIPLAVGFLTAAASGYLAIRIVWRVMERGRLAIFAPYCALVGAVLLLWGDSFFG